jgi:hypothetical protein
MATITKNSRYRGATVTSVDGSNVILLKKIISVPEGDEDLYVVLDQSNARRPDIISFQVYDTVEYGWAIMEVNNLSNFLELKEGTRLRIPPLDSIQQAIVDSQDR